MITPFPVVPNSVTSLVLVCLIRGIRISIRKFLYFKVLKVLGITASEVLSLASSVRCILLGSLTIIVTTTASVLLVVFTIVGTYWGCRAFRSIAGGPMFES